MDHHFPNPTLGCTLAFWDSAEEKSVTTFWAPGGESYFTFRIRKPHTGAHIALPTNSYWKMGRCGFMIQ